MDDHFTMPLQADDIQLRLARRRAQERPALDEPLLLEKPEVKAVLDTDTGRHLHVAAIMGTDYERLMQLRMSS